MTAIRRILSYGPAGTERMYAAPSSQIDDQSVFSMACFGPVDYKDYPAFESVACSKALSFYWFASIVSRDSIDASRSTTLNLNPERKRAGRFADGSGRASKRRRGGFRSGFAD
jgi:hypothetical protein